MHCKSKSSYYWGDPEGKNKEFAFMFVVMLSLSPNKQNVTKMMETLLSARRLSSPSIFLSFCLFKILMLLAYFTKNHTLTLKIASSLHSWHVRHWFIYLFPPTGGLTGGRPLGGEHQGGKCLTWQILLLVMRLPKGFAFIINTYSGFAKSNLQE